MSGRPILEINLEPIDWILEAVGIASIFFLIIIPWMHYSELPETIPIHFGADGDVDAWGSRKFIWILPIVGTIIYIGLTVLSNYPHSFNYLKKITPDNAFVQYRNSVKMIRFIKVLISASFAYLTSIIIDGATVSSNSLGPYFVPGFIIMVFCIIGFFLFKSSK
jgi:uncharacterized membrane protein